MVYREFRKENTWTKEGCLLGIVCQPQTNKDNVALVTCSGSLSQEVTVGFPEEILTYPGGSGNVDRTAVGFWDILGFMNNFFKAPVVDIYVKII